MRAQRIMSVLRSVTLLLAGFLLAIMGSELVFLVPSARFASRMRDMSDVITWTKLGCGRQDGQAGRRQGRRAGGVTDTERRSAERDRSGVHRWRFLRSRGSAAGEVRDGAARPGGGRAGGPRPPPPPAPPPHRLPH